MSKEAAGMAAALCALLSQNVCWQFRDVHYTETRFEFKASKKRFNDSW